LAWKRITLSGANVPNSGTYSEPLQLLDSIRFRCTVTIPASNTTAAIDRSCPAMTSTPAYVVMPKVRPNTTLAASIPTDNQTTSISKSQASLSSAQAAAPIVTNNEPIPGKQSRKSVTVDLLTAPNPAETLVGLSFRLPDEAATTIEIVDALQRTVLIPQANVVLPKGNQEFTISVGSLPSGAYSVRVKAVLKNGVVLLENRSLIIVR
jgi:hypothetical protein